ncbi:MAG: HNH endonuclease, partial [Planctomycetota bacterium]
GCRELEWLVRSCLPGDRPPSGSGGGGLPKVRFHVHAELGALDHEIWEQAKQKLARERGTAVTDAELMAELSRMLLSTRADGSIPGRKPVSGSCFQVVVDAKTRAVQTDDGPVPLSDAEVEVAVSDGASQLNKVQRRKVLDRDGRRCRCCRSRRNLQIHHLQFVSQGGESKADNLLALCSYCHSRIHEGLLRVRGKAHGELEFQDRRGRSLRGALPHRLRSSSRHRSSNRLRSFDQPQSRADYTLRQQVVTGSCQPGHLGQGLGAGESRTPQVAWREDGLGLAMGMGLVQPRGWCWSDRNANTCSRGLCCLMVMT